jgi:putative transposase
MAERLRELPIQGCESRGITIVEGSVGKEHVYMLISCLTHIAPAKMVQYLKGRSSRLIQEEFPEVKKRYWARHVWARGRFCATVGTATQEMIREYMERLFEHGDKKYFKIEGEGTGKDEFQL